MSKSLTALVATSPTCPGIYKFFNDKQEIIYVGKAKNLRHRLQSYFRASAKHEAKTTSMLSHVVNAEWIETNSEIEALILEDNLIKTLQPKYNILLKDDKNFQYIKVTLGQDYPEVYTVRRITKDGAKYFGPKTSGTDVYHLMESVRRVFRLCSVKNITIDPKGTPLESAKVAVKIGGVAAKRPCLDYHIRRCTGPCAGIVTPEEYRHQIDQAVDFLSGNFKPAIEALKKQMMEFATEKKFERAAALRDQIGAIERSANKQLITDTSMSDRDVIAYVGDMGKNYFNLFQIRGGRLIGQEQFIADGEDTPAEIMESFLREYYGLAADIPKEVLISVPVEDQKLLEEYITRQTNHKVHLVKPQIGRKDDLIMLGEKNARSFAEASRVRWMADERKAGKALEELKVALKLEKIPKRIECYDISHLGGTETVGSMVVFKNGEPANADYRQFRLRSTAHKNDDFMSMEEVISRRLNYLPQQLPEGYKIMKAKKADADAIQKLVAKIDDFKVEEFQLIKKGTSIVAMARLISLSDKVHCFNTLWVEESERGKKLGYFVLKALIEKSKQSRLYIACRKELENYYLKFGFENLIQPPKELADYMKGKKDVLYMAYQKKKKDLSFTARPDLMVIDGGKGQLGVAVKVMKEKRIELPVISLAKKLEEVYIPEKPDPINLPNNSEGSYLLQRIRDEAHRFAIEFNRGSREKTMTQSALDKIQGIGPKLRKRLLTHFGSVQGIREAREVELQVIAGEDVARRIKENL